MRHNGLFFVKVLMITAFVCGVGLVSGTAAEDQMGKEKQISPAKEKGRPKIQFDALGFDFGKTVQGETLEHVFSFKNSGTGPLNIKRVKAG